MKNARDYEDDYLALTFQLEVLLHKKAVAHGLQAEIEGTHALLVALAAKITTSEDSRPYEAEYLAATGRLQELLVKKRQANSLLVEFQVMHEQLETLARRLNWGSPTAITSPLPSSATPALSNGANIPDEEWSDRLVQLQSEIQELRTAFS